MIVILEPDLTDQRSVIAAVRAAASRSEQTGDTLHRYKLLEKIGVLAILKTSARNCSFSRSL